MIKETGIGGFLYYYASNCRLKDFFFFFFTCAMIGHLDNNGTNGTKIRKTFSSVSLRVRDVSF